MSQMVVNKLTNYPIPSVKYHALHPMMAVMTVVWTKGAIEMEDRGFEARMEVGVGVGPLWGG